MEVSKAAVATLAAVCITAGAGGAFLATRGNVPEPAPSLGADAPLISPDPGAGVAVDQSEALVAEAPAPSVVAPVPESRPAAPAAQPARSPAEPRPRRVERSRELPAEEPIERAAAAPSPLPAAVVTPPEPLLPPAPPPPLFEELVLAADSVIGLQVETSVTSERARVEDQVIARVTRDVRVGDRVAIPAGSKVHGEVTLVERGGKVREKARLGVRFTSLVLADGTRVPIQTDTIYREGDGPGNESAAKIGGGAIGGAIIGGILGGAKGAVIGGSAGAGAGTAAVLAGGRNPATRSAGAPVTVRLEQPVAITVEK